MGCTQSLSIFRKFNKLQSQFRFNKFRGGKKMLLEIPIEYSIEDLRELAERKGIDINHKSRGNLIRELLNKEEDVLPLLRYTGRFCLCRAIIEGKV